MNNPILIIDAGHGEKDLGCRHGNLFEKDLTLKISLYQLERFNQLGINAVITRDKDIYLSPSERTRIIKDSKAKYCISNHINAGGGQGCEVIHSIYNNGQLAHKIFDNLIAAGLKGRRVFCKESTKYPQKDYYFIHRQTGSCTTNIVEYGFIDNEGDREKILNNWQDYAESVIKAFCSYIDHLYIPPRKEEDVENIEFKDAINTLVSHGVINSPDYWLNADNYKYEYVKELIKNIAKKLG